MKNRSLHWAWIILGTCFVDVFINYSVRLGYGVVLPEMIRTLGLSRTAGGSIYNAYLFSYILLTPLTGYLTDRFGARTVITACSFILGIGVILMGTTTTLLTSCLFYAVVGLGATGMWTPVLAVVQRWFAPTRRGLALGIVSTGYGLGFATMGALFPWIVARYEWRYAWYFLGACALLMVFLNGLLLRSEPENVGYKPWGEKGNGGVPSVRTASREKIHLSVIFKERAFWLIGFSYFAIAYSLYGITTFMVDYAKTQMGLPLEKASLLATVHGFSQVIGVLTVLPFSDRLGRRNTILYSNAFITATLVGILFVESPTTLFILVGVLAVFYGATFPMYGACAGDYFPKNVIGTAVGVWTTFYGTGAILSHWVTGLLRDSMGTYQEAYIINAAMAGVALVLMGFVHTRQP
jgi:sugar phosphate permease